MPFLAPRTLLLLGSLVGISGCSGGTADGESVAGSAGDSHSNAGASSAGGASVNGGGSVGQAGNGNTSGGSSGVGGSSSTTGGSSASGGSASGGTPSGSAGNPNSGGSGGSPTTTPHDCKRGVAWAGKSLTNTDVSSQLTWWYAWALSVQNVGAGLEFVPMISGGGHNATNDTKLIRSDAKYLLGYNEPNFMSQANLTAAQAAADWHTVESVAQAHHLKIVSPAVNYCGDDKTGTGPCNGTNPATYLKDFFAACQGCQVDYVAVHWYNCDGASLKSYLDMFKQFNRPIWLTEFACAYGGDTSPAGQEKYMREAIPILEGRADVFRYAWFSGDPIPDARLLNADGSPTALGKIYLSLPHDPTCTP